MRKISEEDSLVFLYALTERYKGWEITIHSQHGPNESHKKHIHLKNGKIEYSWNIDGTRHDNHRFSKNEKSIETAKDIASKKLGIDRNILQFIVFVDAKERFTLKEDNNTIIYRYYVKKDFIVCVLSTDRGVIILEVDKI
ncbi:MAG: hypothetical protein QG567_1139 [Campylobacterota bacterium]|nr:hypothetical protein [Campylobacterota bacterium]